MSYLRKLVFDKLRIKNSFGENYDEDNYMELAEITRQYNKITFFAKSWANLCENLDEYVILSCQVITHETLHAVIDKVITADGLEVYDEHFPHLNGMDEPYANNYE